MESGNKAVGRAWFEALMTGDGAALESLMSETVTWHLHGNLPVAGHYEGRDVVLTEFLAQGQALFEAGSMNADLTTLVGDGNHVVLEWHARARSAAGVNYDNEYCVVLEMEDGQIHAVREYADTDYARPILFP